MNLHSIVAPAVGAVNPLQLVGVAISIGNTILPDGTQVPAYATPGAITASVAGTVLNVSAVTAGLLEAAQTLADFTAALRPGTMITAQLSGPLGGVGTYSVSEEQTVASETMITSMSILAQVQPMSAGDLRHMDALNLQGSHRKLYVAADIHGIRRPNLKGGDLVTLPDGSMWLVTQPLESFYSSAGWNSCAITLQNG